MNKLKILIALLLLFSVFGVNAQNPGSGGQMEIPTNGIITGKVVDDQGNPVEYATISLLSLRDSSIAGGTISDAGGVFKMTGLKLGVYCMNIKVLGFETKKINPIYLMPKGRGKGEGIEQDFGSITLGSSDYKLDDVTIVGEKSRVQYKIDKKVINASQDINSSSGSAVDILQNTPSVNVDIDGNVELRGSSNFTVLIDGKPSILTGSEALQQIPANLVENIEIITNPSAKFDPEGAAGIINVVMKKKKSLGLTGIVNVSVGTGDKYKGNITLANRVGKFGFSAGIDYRDEKRYGNGTMYQEYYDSAMVNYTSFDGRRDMNMYGLGFQGGIDFFINNKNTLSISGRYYDRDFAHVSDSYYHEWSLPSTSDSYYLRKSESGFGGKNYNLSLDYNLKFAKPEQKLDFSFTYAKRDGVRKNDLFEYVTDASKNIDNDYDPILNKQDETGPDNDFRFKVDFVSPVGNSGMIEAGYQGRYEKEDEKSVYSTFNALNNTWEVNPARSNEINSTNNIQALYATWASKVLGFEYKVGIRGEYNFRTLYPVSGDNYEYKRFEIFPDAYLTRHLSKTQQIQLSYSRRINRPDGRELDPFINWSDPDRPRGGNPELEPEYVDSYELNFQQQLSKSFISLETYFRRTNNLITDITIDWGDGILFRTYENQNYDNSLGIELNANIFLTQWWRLNASGTGFYYQLSGASDAVDVLKESFNYNFRFDNSFTLKKKTRIQITGFYRGPQVTVQGERKAVFFSNIAARQDFLKGKMTATLQIQDIFGASGWKFTEQTEFYRAEMNFTREPRVVTLSITYRLNNFKQKRNGNGEGREDSEMDMDMGM